MTIEELNILTKEFSNLFLKNKIKINSFSELYDLDLNWPDTYPYNLLPGVYALLDENKDLYYFGSTLVAIGERFKKYFGYDSNKKCLKSMKYNNISFLTTVGFDDKIKYLIPALEYYLISKFNPPGNRNLKIK